MDIPVLYEDEGLLAIDKPCGVSVTEEDFGSLSNNDIGERLTIKKWVRDRYNYRSLNGEQEDGFEQRFGMVHRIDKETSGVLLIAKTPFVFDFLKGLFKYRKISKEYQALVYGAVPDDSFEITAPVGRSKRDGTAYSVETDGREAATCFRVIKRYQPETLMTGTSNKQMGFLATYLIASPRTGRTHQIRVHLKALGHPVVNDYKYASKRQLMLSGNVFDRMMLHAKSISFYDWDGKKRLFVSPRNLSDLLP